MDLCLHIVSFFVFFTFAQAQDRVFIYRQSPPCFKVKDARCKSSLVKDFQSNYAVSGNGEPDTKLYLFTPKNKDKAEQLQCYSGLPDDTNFDPQANTTILIHGVMDGVCRTAWMREIRDQYFIRDKYNVILVDWTWGNKELEMAENNSRIVGEQVGFIINNIIKQTNQSTAEKFHLIGHSLGAVASGYAGRQVKGKPRRITGLDPSYLTNPSVVIEVSYTDAKIVDFIHSNSDHGRDKGRGNATTEGHADFYPNGGLIQCSCYPYIFMHALEIGDINYSAASLSDPRLCFHLQSIQYYKVSINPDDCEFIGLACDTYQDFLDGKCDNNEFAVMGADFEKYYKDDGKQKMYYLNTCLFYPNYVNNSKALEGRDDLPFDNLCTECKQVTPNPLLQNETEKALTEGCLKAFESFQKNITSENQQASTTKSPGLLGGIL